MFNDKTGGGGANHNAHRLKIHKKYQFVFGASELAPYFIRFVLLYL